MSERKNNQGSFLGIILILIGLLFLIDTFTNWNFSRLLGEWWPLIFVVIAIIKFQNQERGSGLIFLIIGGLLLLLTNDVIGWHSVWRLWPLILVFIGISLIFKGRRRNWGLINDATHDTDFIHSNAIFGGAVHTITSQNFKGGEAMALFGGVELDLRDAKLSSEGCKINATAIFGAGELIVPDDWKVVVKGTPLFGAVDNKSRGKGGDPTKEIELHCTVIFGGLEIR